MSLNIKNPETERLAREVAGLTDESVTGAITTALRERLERLRSEEDRRQQHVVEAIMRIAKDAGPRWQEPYRSQNHGDLLYDERGLPR